MDNTVKTNLLAVISFTSGVIALLSLALYWGLFAIVFPSAPENAPSAANRILITILDASVSLRNLCAPVALITGILALRDIKKKEGTEKGKPLAWIGIILGSVWLIFGLLVGITFLLAEILH